VLRYPPETSEQAYEETSPVRKCRLRSPALRLAVALVPGESDVSRVRRRYQARSSS